MRAAVSAGLSEIEFSTGHFHARFVPLERVAIGARAAVLAGIKTTIAIEEFEDATVHWRAITEHPLLKELVRSHALHICRELWIPREDLCGKPQVTHDKSRSRFREENKGGCSSLLNVVSVTPDLELMACCGYTMTSIDSLRIGSVAVRSITEVLAETPFNPLHRWISTDGPEAILEAVRDRIPGYRLPVDSVSICSTCLFLHSDPLAMRMAEQLSLENAKRTDAKTENCTAEPAPTPAPAQ